MPLSEVTLSKMDGTMSAGMSASAAEFSGAYVSGTSQSPAVRPMNMLHKRIGDWNVMFHGVLWGVYTDQGGPRGRDKTFGAGWVMPMASRKLAGGIFTLRTMFSIEPLTVRDGRYPLLLQSGETWKNIPILNGQHPHDFVKELAGAYQYRLGENTTFNLYAGLRGDPAIGPTAYPHRISASENPIAVMAHHYQDSTHISSNVVTAGVTHRWVTLEASGFHGREPDEKRWGIEMGAIDSFASRVTVTPTSRWAMQYSVGRINNREATHPDRDSFRQTASATYVRPSARGHPEPHAHLSRHGPADAARPREYRRRRVSAAIRPRWNACGSAWPLALVFFRSARGTSPSSARRNPHRRRRVFCWCRRFAPPGAE